MNHSSTFHYITEYLEYYAKNTPHALAVKDNASSVTYFKLNQKAERFSKLLINMGVNKCDRIIIIGDNCVEFIIAIYGCLKAGAIFIPLHTSTTKNRIQYIIENSECKVIITTNSETIDDIENDITIIPFLNEDQLYNNFAVFHKITEKSNNKYKNAVNEDDIAIIIYTSGTTGYPKGVVESHKSIAFSVNSINSVIGNTSKDRILCGLPLSFDYGLYQVFLAFSVGAALILIPDFHNPLSLPRVLAEEKISGFPLVPSVAASLIHSKLLERISLPHLRYITSTGDTFHLEHINKFKELWPNVLIFPMYGLTECKRVSILSPNDYIGHENSVGKPIPGTSAYIVDENGNKLKENETGILIVSGPHVMNGYWRDKAETIKRFFINAENHQNSLITNDIFYMDIDGFLYYVGRDEAIIKSNGYRIGVSEIERIITQLDSVVEVCAIGIEDKERGQIIVLHIYSNDKNLSEDNIRKQFYTYFSRDIVIKTIIFHKKALPKTTNGKLDRRFLAAMEA